MYSSNRGYCNMTKTVIKSKCRNKSSYVIHSSVYQPSKSEQNNNGMPVNGGWWISCRKCPNAYPVRWGRCFVLGPGPAVTRTLTHPQVKTRRRQSTRVIFLDIHSLATCTCKRDLRFTDEHWSALREQNQSAQGGNKKTMNLRL